MRLPQLLMRRVCVKYKIVIQDKKKKKKKNKNKKKQADETSVATDLPKEEAKESEIKAKPVVVPEEKKEGEEEASGDEEDDGEEAKEGD